MTDITRAVRAIRQADFVAAQEILNMILEDASRIDFQQAVVLQFSLLDKQLKAHLINEETHMAVTLKKIRAIQAKNLENEDLNDYLDDRLLTCQSSSNAMKLSRST